METSMTSHFTPWMEKTYSGEQSFHEKLIAAQAYSPPHLWALCHILCSLKMDPSKDIQESNWIDMSSRWTDGQELHYYFSDSGTTQCKMFRMIDHSFGTQVIWLQLNDSTQRPMVRICTWTQFCSWIQSGVVTIDNKKKLVTIHP